MIVEREELMVPPNNGGLPILRKAHFLKPISNPQNQLSPPQLPSTNHPLNPNKKLISNRIRLRGMVAPLNSWKSWVDSLQQTHQESWKKAGIFDAIKASTYHIIRDNKLIIELAEKWCPETNTFVFSWGESTITLEDVMILGGFSVLGTSAGSQYRIKEDGDVRKLLVESYKKIKKRYNLSAVTQNAWLTYFKGRGGELEHVALIVLWLSRYVFASNSFCTICSAVFSIAVSLSRGTRIAFAPAILALIYRDLRLLKEKIVNCMIEGQDNGSKLVLWAPFQLLQVWVWERFPALGPKPISLAQGEPRVARWHETRISKSGDSRPEIESAGNDFLWRPYALHLPNWKLLKFYCDQEIWLLVTSELDDQLMSFARCLSPCELEGIDCVEQYLPQRVAKQFALDQDIPFSVPRSSAAYKLAWKCYDKSLHGKKFYLPPRLYEGDVTLQYSKWWRTPSILHDDCERPRRHKRKLKTVSEVLDTCHEKNTAHFPSCSSHKFEGFDSFGCSSEKLNANSTLCRANALEAHVAINLQMQPNDNADKCKDNVMEEEEQKRANDSVLNIGQGSKPLEETHFVGSGTDMLIGAIDPPCSSSQRIEVLDLVVVGSGSNMHNDKSTSNEIIEHQIVENETIDIELLEMVNSVTEPENEENFEYSAMKVDENKGVCESNKIMGGVEKFSGGTCSLDEKLVEDNGMLSGEGPSVQAEMNALLGENVEDVQHNAKEDADTQQMKTSMDDIVVISDEEDNPNCNPFEELFMDFEARINELDRIVSAFESS